MDLYTWLHTKYSSIVYSGWRFIDALVVGMGACRSFLSAICCRSLSSCLSRVSQVQSVVVGTDSCVNVEVHHFSLARFGPPKIEYQLEK